MASNTIPIILAGKTEVVARSAIEDFKPHCEVVHFTFTNDASREIPLLSRGEVPSGSNSLGTGNWSILPKAIVFGGNFDDAEIDALRKLTAEAGGNSAKRIPWLRLDSSKPSPPVGPELVKAVVSRAKEALQKLEEEGKLTEGADEEYYF